jgi:hypothetical protein
MALSKITNLGTLTENIVFQDTKGINFGNASGSASGSLTSLLEDYEEGTWTPTVMSGTIAVVSGSSRYVKIGNLVTCYARILSFSDTTSSNGFHVQSLPFTVNTAHTDANIGNAWGNSIGDYRSLFFYSQTNSTQTLGYYGAPGNGYNQTIHSDFVAETNMIIKLTYMTA